MRNHPDLQQILGSPGNVLQAMDDFSEKHDFLINIGTDKGRIVTDLIAQEKPKILVEMGGYVGYSSILFANEMRKSHSDARLWSLEYSPEFANIIREMVKLAGLQDTVTVVSGPADEGLRSLKREGKIDHIDMLFLDHVEDLYKQDLKVAMDELGLLKSGATIVADNVLWPGAPDYRRYVRRQKGLSSRGVKGRVMPGNYPVSHIGTQLWNVC